MIIRIMIFVFCLVSGCSKKVVYSIPDVEAIGFEKDSQQLCQMVGAMNGWSGAVEGERVEFYEFESSSGVNTDAFEK